MGVLENSITITHTVELPAIRSVFKGDSAIVAYGVVKLAVNRFLGSFGFSTKPSEIQTETMARDILDKFSYESLEDIILFLKMARQGKFGVTGRGVDSNLIIGDWMPKYLEIKAEERETLHLKEKHNMLKSESSDAVLKVYKHHAGFRKREKDEKEFREYVENMTKGITREQLESLIEKCEQVEAAKPFMYIMKAKRKTIFFKCSCCFREEKGFSVFITSKHDGKLYCAPCYTDNH